MVLPLMKKQTLSEVLKTLASYGLRLRLILEAFRNSSAVAKPAIVPSPADVWAKVQAYH
jgi:hypothetical protein